MPKNWKLMKYIILMICLISAACTTSPKTSALTNPVLVKIAKADRSHYIVGTIHFPLDVEKMYPVLYSRLDESTLFIYETDIRKMKKTSSDQLPKESLYYKNEKDGKLENDLSPGAFNLAKDKLSYFNSNFAALKPQGAYDLIIERRNKFKTEKLLSLPKKELFETSQIAYRTDGRLYDAQLADYAFAHKKTILTLDDQPGGHLVKKCDQLTAIANLEQMAVDEKTNATDQFYQEALKKSNRCLLEERNQAWMKTLKPIFAGNDKAFVAVGMAHLSLGDSPLLQMLAAEGYTVEYIKPENN